MHTRLRLCRHCLIFHPHNQPVIQQVWQSPLHRCGCRGLESLNNLPPGHMAGEWGTGWASETMWRERPCRQPAPKPQTWEWGRLRPPPATATSWLHDWTQARRENHHAAHGIKGILNRCSKPLRFEVVCYTALHNWYSLCDSTLARISFYSSDRSLISLLR